MTSRQWSGSGEQYRWTCPICGTSRTNWSENRSARDNAVVALRAHVLASAGDGHGPQGERPEGLDDEDLFDCVVLADESE